MVSFFNENTHSTPHIRLHVSNVTATPGMIHRDNRLLLLRWQNDAVIFLLEPFDRFFFRESVLNSDLASLPSAVRHVVASTAEHNEKVQTVDTDRGIVLDAEIDVLLNTESKVA